MSHFYPYLFPVTCNFEIDRWNSELAYCFSFYLFIVFAIIVKNTGLSDFEINYKANVPGLPTRRFGARVFKLFATIEIGSYA